MDHQNQLIPTQQTLEDISIDSLCENITELLQSVFRPKPSLTYLEWAEKHFSIQNGARKGRYYSSNAAYQRGIFKACDEANEVVLKTSSRVGKTLIQLIVMGFHIDQDPTDIMFVVPDESFADDFAKESIEKTISGNPCLSRVIPKTSSKDALNTIRNKYWATGSLRIASAGVKNQLTGKFVRVLLLDEVSKYPETSSNAGDPVNLAKKRTENPLGNEKIVLASTPLYEGDRITIAYNNSSQGKYHIKCVHCEEHFLPTWELVKWSTEPDHQPETAGLVCNHCGGLHNDTQRYAAILNGEWVHAYPERKVKGFHLSTIVSTAVKLSSLVEDYLNALGKPYLEQQFWNETLGETYELRGERVDDIQFGGRLEEYTPDTIPNEIKVLTAGCDVQANRIECVVTGWGNHFENWNIDHLIIHGAPNDPTTWDTLHNELQQQYTRTDGIKLKIARTGIDTGGNTLEIGGFSEYVRKFCKDNSRYGYMAFKGASTENQTTIFPTHLKKNHKVYLINTIMAKDMLYKNLAVKEPGPSYCHFPISRTTEFFNQLTSEERIVTKTNTGRKQTRYQRIKNRSAEVLDCTVYALASYFSLNRREEVNAEYRIKKQLEKPVETEENTPELEEITEKTPEIEKNVEIINTTTDIQPPQVKTTRDWSKTRVAF